MRKFEMAPKGIMLFNLIVFLGGCLLAWPLVTYVPEKFLLIGVIALQLSRFVEVEW